MKKPTTYLLVSNYTTNIIHGSVKMFKRSLSNVKIIKSMVDKNKIRIIAEVILQVAKQYFLETVSINKRILFIHRISNLTELRSSLFQQIKSYQH